MVVVPPTVPDPRSVPPALTMTGPVAPELSPLMKSVEVFWTVVFSAVGVGAAQVQDRAVRVLRVDVGNSADVAGDGGVGAGRVRIDVRDTGDVAGESGIGAAVEVDGAGVVASDGASVKPAAGVADVEVAGAIDGEIAGGRD